MLRCKAIQICEIVKIALLWYVAVYFKCFYFNFNMFVIVIGIFYRGRWEMIDESFLQNIRLNIILVKSRE